ncbi:hypothetical protein NL676_004855 [Syzygium grande]|nr:hypothetical protein NL676_004855 [Syzygium grande]
MAALRGQAGCHSDSGGLTVQFGQNRGGVEVRGMWTGREGLRRRGGRGGMHGGRTAARHRRASPAMTRPPSAWNRTSAEGRRNRGEAGRWSLGVGARAVWRPSSAAQQWTVAHENKTGGAESARKKRP